jgi:acetyl-CoA acetyltransferase
MTDGGQSAAIAGTGEVGYVRGTDKSERRLILEAAVAACADAGIAPETVDGYVLPWFDSMNPEPGGEDFIQALGIRDLRYHAHLHMGGAASVAAVVNAAAAIRAGLASRVVIATGWTAYSDRFRTPLAAGGPAAAEGSAVIGRDVRRNLDAPLGCTVPTQWYSLHANRWLHETGADPAGLETVALTTRAHAQLNPRAFMRGRPLTAEQYRAAPVLVQPFRLFDICLETDGAAAVLMTSAAQARQLTRHRPVYVGPGAEGHADNADDLATRPDMLQMGITKAARRLFESSPIGLDQVDFAELYDCYTFIVLRQLEEIGFCDRGKSPEFVRGGTIALGGALPVNTHGGLLSQAHVLGMNHVVEAVRQLRHEAGQAQVARARVGLVSGYGGQGDGSLVLLHNEVSR